MARGDAIWTRRCEAGERGRPGELGSSVGQSPGSAVRQPCKISFRVWLKETHPDPPSLSMRSFRASSAKPRTTSPRSTCAGPQLCILKTSAFKGRCSSRVGRGLRKVGVNSRPRRSGRGLSWCVLLVSAFPYTGLIHHEQLLRSLDTFYPRSIVSRSRESAVILAALKSGAMRPRLLAFDDDHGLRRDDSGHEASSVEFDEFAVYQDLWFGDRVGDDKGDHRWMADEPEWWSPLVSNISCVVVVLIELCAAAQGFLGPI